MSGVASQAPWRSGPMLPAIFFYASMFHLGLPLLAYVFVAKSVGQAQGATSTIGSTLGLDAGSLWQPWPRAEPSGLYLGMWGLCLLALAAAWYGPRWMVRRTAAKKSSGGKRQSDSMIFTFFLVRTALLELCSIAGFAAAVVERQPGLALPMGALGLAGTLALPPIPSRLAKVVAMVSAALVALILFEACVTVPETGRSQLVAVPEAYMNQVGAQAYGEMKAKERLSRDAKLVGTIEDIGQKIAKASHKFYDWEFSVFDSQEVNAFCLPGGKIGVYTGIIPVAKTNAGLAAILGHEVAHAVARHSAERSTQSLIVSGALISVEKAIQDPKYRQLTMAALGLGVQFGLVLPFSRSHELEADALGLRYMARAGYDPREAVQLWERMGALGGRPPEWLSTHPDPIRRARDLGSRMGEAMALYEGSVKIPTQAF